MNWQIIGENGRRKLKNFCMTSLGIFKMFWNNILLAIPEVIYSIKLLYIVYVKGIEYTQLSTSCEC